MEARIKVISGAARGAFGRLPDGRYLVHVSAKAKNGRANKEACEIIARELGVPRDTVSIIRGKTTPNKTLRVREI